MWVNLTQPAQPILIWVTRCLRVWTFECNKMDKNPCGEAQKKKNTPLFILGIYLVEKQMKEMNLLVGFLFPYLFCSPIYFVERRRKGRPPHPQSAADFMGPLSNFRRRKMKGEEEWWCGRCCGRQWVSRIGNGWKKGEGAKGGGGRVGVECGSYLFEELPSSFNSSLFTGYW